MKQLASGSYGGNRRSSGRSHIEDWASLQIGERVEVWPTISFRYTAYVDDRADDGRLVWLVEHGTGSRRLYVRGDAVEIFAGSHKEFDPHG
ncbi:hypothetical protein SA2016_3842 [Sinomonas atrocyanea]|uniref:Uncharacterized protein n=1 Tax=Sinomonas atrocyanea TaxID=37927 RepID=A0A127A4Y6_9MICC|nr:hypothetical protein [Sinomonas atrocyanea]AMM34499.1 hypothetical protein SA2016_3842 [Sinomonas atrocyanea]GEB66618.1 hypothetical protein SAT01_40660 [Sinomonas atrocyanea]GGG67834.1 hypothetical protein GCM10007172_19600 [Sinomonas atrocyanea]